MVLTEQELLNQAMRLSGKTLAMIAQQVNVAVPTSQLAAKGWIGILLEKALGATASTKPEPDFVELGVELKTLPLNHYGKPKESTFVCTINLLKLHQETWINSLVYKKLAKVLWVPVEADPSIAMADRRLGSPVLWQPDVEQMAILRKDWCELTDMISLGQLEQITAKHGRYLQIRPKAANAKSLCWGLGPDGRRVKTLPRGFYLRAKFTEQILLHV